MEKATDDSYHVGCVSTGGRRPRKCRTSMASWMEAIGILWSGTREGTLISRWKWMIFGKSKRNVSLGLRCMCIILLILVLSDDIGNADKISSGKCSS